MSPDFLATIAFAILCAALGLVWWEIRGLRKSAHNLANRVTSLIGRMGLIDHRVKKLEEREE